MKHTAFIYAPFVLTLALLAFVLSPSAQAQEMDNTDLLSLGIGAWDIGDDDDAGDFRLEYRPGHEYFWHVKPWLGIEVTSDASVWGGGGILVDIPVADRLYVVPNFGIGIYDEGDSDLDLDYFVEFRSQIEVAYEFDNQQRAGVSFGHISNAGLGDDNPGVEILGVYYHVPVDGIFNHR